MGFKLDEFQCESCSYIWEQLVWNDDPPDPCPHCHEAPQKVLTAVKLAGYSILDKDSQWQVLRKRSEEHSAKMKKREEFPERKKKKKKP